MKVTKVSLSFPFRQGATFRCWARIVLDDVLMVSGIRLFERKTENGIESNILFPDRVPPLHQTGGERVSIAIVNTTDPDLRNHIRDEIVKAYNTHPRNPKNRKKSEEASS